MSLQRFERVGGTGRLIATVKAHPWAEQQPIAADGEGDKTGEKAHDTGISAGI